MVFTFLQAVFQTLNGSLDRWDKSVYSGLLNRSKSGVFFSSRRIMYRGFLYSLSDLAKNSLYFFRSLVVMLLSETSFRGNRLLYISLLMHFSANLAMAFVLLALRVSKPYSERSLS